MKKIISIAILVFTITSLFASKGLVVTQKLSDASLKGATVNVTWYVTETQCKLKMQFSDGNVKTTTWFIPNIETKQLLTYTEGAVPAGAEKVFYSVPAESIKGGLNVSRVSVNKTGETKTISGIACEKIIIKTNRTTTEMWVTKDFKADFYKFYPFFLNSYELLGLNEEAIQGFPISSVTKDNAGAVISSYDLVSATSAELSASDLTVPSEYKSAEEVSRSGK